jgi:hypothetical protein
MTAALFLIGTAATICAAGILNTLRHHRARTKRR